MIKKAPLTFLIGFSVLAILIGWGEYKCVFQEMLTLKDEQINALKSRYESRGSHIDNSHPSAKIPKADISGPANTSGVNSPAITGDNNTTTYDDSKPEKPRETN